jgi:2-iminobutanoate/2-iminopropanoate deaminase
LEAAGTDLEHVLKTTVYLSTVDDFNKRNEIFDKMNAAYASHFKVPPARAIVFVKSWGIRKRLIEIDAIAGMP